jgi:hypothetical protein
MAGEDPWDPGPISWDFRKKCHVCGKQIQFVGGQRVEPDCGHEIAAIGIEVGGDDS